MSVFLGDFVEWTDFEQGQGTGSERKQDNR